MNWHSWKWRLARLLRLKAVPQPSDAADGVAAALASVMGARTPTLRTHAVAKGRTV